MNFVFINDLRWDYGIIPDSDSDSLGNLKESCWGCGKIRIVMEERKGI